MVRGTAKRDHLDSHVFEDNPQSTDFSSAEAVPLTVHQDADEEVYKMDHKRRGIAVVINQMYCQGRQPRHGSAKDTKSIRATLEKLQFEVILLEELTWVDLYLRLREIASTDHSEHDCLVVTHGAENELEAKDTSYSVDFLLRCFTGKASPSLVGKPKLFFIQACRGNSLDEGVKVQFVPKDADAVDAQVKPETPRTMTIPNMSDLLVMFSSCKGHYSWRNNEHGSWFIQALCKELATNGEQKELMQMLTTVSRRVALDYQSHVPHDPRMHGMKQMPCILSMLTKTVFFPPKLTKELSTNFIIYSEKLRN